MRIENRCAAHLQFADPKRRFIFQPNSRPSRTARIPSARLGTTLRARAAITPVYAGRGMLLDRGQRAARVEALIAVLALSPLPAYRMAESSPFFLGTRAPIHLEAEPVVS